MVNSFSISVFGSSRWCMFVKSLIHEYLMNCRSTMFDYGCCFLCELLLHVTSDLSERMNFARKRFYLFFILFPVRAFKVYRYVVPVKVSSICHENQAVSVCSGGS